MLAGRHIDNMNIFPHILSLALLFYFSNLSFLLIFLQLVINDILFLLFELEFIQVHNFDRDFPVLFGFSSDLIPFELNSTYVLPVLFLLTLQLLNGIILPILKQIAICLSLSLLGLVSTGQHVLVYTACKFILI